MALSRPYLRVRTFLVGLLLVTFVTWICSQYTSEPEQSYDSTTANRRFWSEFEPLLTQHAPDCEPPVRLANAESITFNPDSAEPPPGLLQMAYQDLVKMKNEHSQFVDAIQNPPALYYKPATRGLVSTAGGSYLPVLVISLRMLRAIGSALPMEVFLGHWNEYDGYICQVVLPALNARCVVLSEILDAVPGSQSKIEKYQYKLLAMLFSSFEEILFLDADAFPLQQPESLFTSEPFKSKGLITWPDFWGSTTSSIYYEISSQERPPPNLRQSTESGEVVISKKSHMRTLLLSAYYNFWGPSYYYPLLSQGAAGEGDKETFIAAASALNEPFYQVSEPIRALGRHRYDGSFAGSTMIQFNPIEDYALTSKGEWRIKGSSATAPKPFFIHANFPKFNPATIFVESGPVVNELGKYTRAWTAPEEVVEAYGPDVERQFWAQILWTACTLEGKILSWEGQTGICEQVKDYWSIMFG